MSESTDPRDSPSALRWRVEQLEIALHEIVRRSELHPRNWRDWRRDGIALETAHAIERTVEDIHDIARNALQGGSAALRDLP